MLTQCTVVTTDSPTVLQRVIAVCARRQCDVISLVWHRDGRGGEMFVTAAGDEAQLATLGTWLLALVDVVAVESAPLEITAGEVAAALPRS